MRSIRTARLLEWIAILCFLGWGIAALHARETQQARRVQLVLLVPDEAALDHPITHAWLDAAQEEGLALAPMTDDAFMRALANHHPMAAVILPDGVHRQASDVLVHAIYRYAEQGGRVLVGFDAALLEPQQGAYADRVSRLSRLVGVSYALYEELKNNSTRWGPVYASREAEQQLAIQPGKLDFTGRGTPGWGELTTYGYPTLHYSHFKTTAPGDLNILLTSSDGDPIVSTHAFGQGAVMFANLPLGYLKTRTDSYLLHLLLRHFLHTMAQQPLLASTAGGLGGMVLNLHVDSNAAPSHLKTLEDTGWFDDGPFSIHITAGPDSVQDGDRLGLDLPHNPWMQNFLQRLHNHGHEIGNHGGWKHNIFGTQAHATNNAQFESYLALNQQAVSRAIGQPAVSYSAPMGNQPEWVTAWLRHNGFKGYYSTSDTGLGPTRSYINGRPAPDSGLWTFPISNFKQIATAEELHTHGLDENEFNGFIHDLLNHVSEQGLVRLLYFHPTAMLEHAGAFDQLRADATRLSAQGRFRWYSMAELSDFQNRRMAVQWHSEVAPDGLAKRITAQSADSLNHMTWVMPKSVVRAPRLVEGAAQVTRIRGQWHVIAGDRKHLKFEWQETSSELRTPAPM